MLLGGLTRPVARSRPPERRHASPVRVAVQSGRSLVLMALVSAAPVSLSIARAVRPATFYVTWRPNMSRSTLQAARTPPRVTRARRGSVGSVAGTDGAGLSGRFPSRLLARLRSARPLFMSSGGLACPVARSRAPKRRHASPVRVTVQSGRSLVLMALVSAAPVSLSIARAVRPATFYVIWRPNMSRSTLQAARTPPRITRACRGSVGSVAGTDGAGLSGRFPSRLLVCGPPGHSLC